MKNRGAQHAVGAPIPDRDMTPLRLKQSDALRETTEIGSPPRHCQIFIGCVNGDNARALALLAVMGLVCLSMLMRRIQKETSLV